MMEFTANITQDENPSVGNYWLVSRSAPWHQQTPQAQYGRWLVPAVAWLLAAVPEDGIIPALGKSRPS